MCEQYTVWGPYSVCTINWWLDVLSSWSSIDNVCIAVPKDFRCIRFQILSPTIESWIYRLSCHPIYNEISRIRDPTRGHSPHWQSAFMSQCANCQSGSWRAKGFHAEATNKRIQEINPFLESHLSIPINDHNNRNPFIRSNVIFWARQLHNESPEHFN